MLLSSTREVLADRARQEQNHDDCRRDPERAIEVRVALEDVEEVLARVEGCAAAGQDLVGVDVEELLVEGDAPEKAFGGWLLAGAWSAEEGGRGLGFGGAGGGVERCGVVLLVFHGTFTTLGYGCGAAYWSCGIRGCLLGGRYGQGRPVAC